MTERNGMAEPATNTLAYLRRLDEKLDRHERKLAELGRRLAELEETNKG